MSRPVQTALLRFLRDRAGNVAIVTALALPVVIGAFGLGAEAASWMSAKRAMQDAADAAAIAAATNAGSTYDAEAKAVAAQYGFKDGADGVSVTASNAAPCPAGAGDGPCYSVTVSRATPLLLAQVVGYQGDTTVGGSPGKLISATAVAVQGASPRPYCLLALGSSGSSPAILTHGAPDADLSGCNLMSNNGATCTGHNLGADVGDAYGENNGCGVVEHSNQKKVPDPYASLADNIPPDDCQAQSPYPTYPQEGSSNGNGNGKGANKNTGDDLPPSNQPSGDVGWHGVVKICGDVKLAGDVTIGSDTTLVIYNGDLDTNGHTLQTAEGVGATVVFAGDNSSNYTHVFAGSGTLDITAPQDGDWKGIAIYQAPNLTNGVDMTYAGNTPTWDVTGIAYFPNSNLTFSGAVNKSSNGKSCFGLVVNSILVNGTANILAHGQCGDAGVTLPEGQVAARGKLVQ